MYIYIHLVTMAPTLANQFHVLGDNMAAVLIVMFLTALVVWYFTRDHYCTQTSGFMNLSYNGYYYDTDTQKFASKEDRSKAIELIIKMFADSGEVYTPAQLAPLSDSFMLTLLESEDETEMDALKARMVMLLDPTYKLVFAAVKKATVRQLDGTINQFANESERQMTYDILVKYFNAKKTPITVPRSRWTDKLLIDTYITLKLPKANAFFS